MLLRVQPHKNGPSPAIFVFSNKHYNLCNKFMLKMSIQYTVLGIEPTTFRTWVSSQDQFNCFTGASNFWRFVPELNEERSIYYLTWQNVIISQRKLSPTWSVNSKKGLNYISSQWTISALRNCTSDRIQASSVEHYGKRLLLWLVQYEDD